MADQVANRRLEEKTAFRDPTRTRQASVRPFYWPNSRRCSCLLFETASLLKCEVGRSSFYGDSEFFSVGFAVYV